MSIFNPNREDSNLELDASVIDDLENENYLKPGFNSYFKDEVKSKIEEFSHWFNSIARLYLLKCEPEESEMYVYLLLNLKKKIKYAISEINKSAKNCKLSFTCSVCDEKIAVESGQNIWKTLQDHPHFEENYCNALEGNDFLDRSCIENGDSSLTNGSIVDDLSEDLNQVVLTEPENNRSVQGKVLNDFKFNFVIKYDQKIEEALYPESLMRAAYSKDNCSEYTVQRCGSNMCVCLLCPCAISRGRVFKISQFIVKNHVSGQKHLKFAQTPANMNALTQYHEFWRSQEPSYQAHQVHFMPEVFGSNVCKCQLCQELVSYNLIVDHIKDTNHKTRILKIYNEGKTNEFYLMDMQVEVYDIDKNLTVVKKGEKQKSKKGENDANGEQPKCILVKFVVEPNGFNLPPRYKEHNTFLSKKSNVITCQLCKLSFSNDAQVVKNHIFNSQHRQLSRLPYPKYNYFCEICNIHLKDENGWDEHFTKGPNKHENMAQSRKNKVGEYECKTCMVVIFGDELSLSRHISGRGTKSGKKKEIKLPYTVKRLFRTNNFIEDEAAKLQIEANKVIHCKEKMQVCCEDLEKALSELYPNCKAYPFGSRISGLGNNYSDLDVFMDIGDMYLGEKHQDSPSQEQFVKKASKLLKIYKDDFCYVVPIPSARTPIVKLHHNFTDFDCDISFRHGLGVENTKFLKFCIDLQPVTQPFILLLKKWSECCKLNEHITNYGLALMAIFFLQTCGYLLSVKTVRNYNPTQSLIIDGWDTLNYTVPIEKMKEFVKPYNSSVKQLLRDFFYYFSKFDYANNIVCPLLGNTIPKLLFHEKPNGESLPIEMKTYVQRVQSENGEQFRGLTPFCVQDPFDLSHNLTKACQHGTVIKLKTLCTLTYEFLDSIE